MSRIAILGAGAWGTALAISLARRGGHELCLWSHSAALAEQLADAGENLHYLPGFTLPVDIQVTSDLPRAIFEADILLCVTPSQHLRGVITHIAPLLTRNQIILSATKGIEETTYLRMSQVVASVANNPFVVLSGPSFAQEVAAGVANGLNLGYNSSAALITRGIAEMTRLAIACGGRRQTLAGLSGVGDLVLTCTGTLSRNRTVGIELGRGRQLPDIIAGLNGKVAEGVGSTAAALGLAARYAVEMPITEQMDAILHHNKSPKEAIRELMSRPGRDE